MIIIPILYYHSYYISILFFIIIFYIIAIWYFVANILWYFTNIILTLYLLFLFMSLGIVDTLIYWILCYFYFFCLYILDIIILFLLIFRLMDYSWNIDIWRDVLLCLDPTYIISLIMMLCYDELFISYLNLVMRLFIYDFLFIFIWVFRNRWMFYYVLINSLMD